MSLSIHVVAQFKQLCILGGRSYLSFQVRALNDRIRYSVINHLVRPHEIGYFEGVYALQHRLTNACNIYMFPHICMYYVRVHQHMSVLCTCPPTYACNMYVFSDTSLYSVGVRSQMSVIYTCTFPYVVRCTCSSRNACIMYVFAHIRMYYVRVHSHMML